MKKLFSLFTLLALCGTSALAADSLKTPETKGGRQLAPTESPCFTYQLGIATSTTEQVLYAGPGTLMSLVLSTGPATGYIVFRDAATAAGGAEAFGRYVATTSATQVFSFGGGFKFTTGLTAQSVGLNSTAANLAPAVACFKKDNANP